jgi:hypothetical protein
LLPWLGARGHSDNARIESQRARSRLASWCEIPKRHILDCFGLKQPELSAIHRLLKEQKSDLENLDSAIEGFNIGMNCPTKESGLYLDA